MSLIPFVRALTCILILTLTSGCAGLALRAKNVDLIGPTPVLNPDLVENIDIIELLDPTSYSIGSKSKRLTLPVFDEYRFEKKPTESKNITIDEAYRNLTATFIFDSDLGKTRRNEIQDRIIAASNQRCAAYVRFLKQMDGETNFQLGLLTTLAATAGAVFSAESTIRASSGLAAFFSGARAEFNQNYFSNQTVHIIVEGIRTRRIEVLKEIHVARKLEPVSDYTVWGAIADAITYHDHCSLVSGLEQAARAVERVSNPGLKEMANVIDQVRQIRSGLDSVTSGAASQVIGGDTIAATVGDSNAAEHKELPLVEYTRAEIAYKALTEKIDSSTPAARKIRITDIPDVSNLSVDKNKYDDDEEEEAEKRLKELKKKVTELTTAVTSATTNILKIVDEFKDTFNTALAKNEKSAINTAQGKVPGLKAAVLVAADEDAKLKANKELSAISLEVGYYAQKYANIRAKSLAATRQISNLDDQVKAIVTAAEEFK